MAKTKRPKRIPSKREILVFQPFGEAFAAVHRNIDRAWMESQTDSNLITFDEAVVSDPMEEFAFQRIKRCDLMICDVTDRTPNIVYAAGYALALHLVTAAGWTTSPPALGRISSRADSAF